MSEVSDLSFVIADGILSESWTTIRSTGSFQLGGWVTTSVTLPGWGVVSVATEEDLEMLPEMDRVTGSIVFHSVDRLYTTEMDAEDSVPGATQRVSDILVWNNLNYRIMHVGPYPNRNYWKAIASRLRGN